MWRGTDGEGSNVSVKLLPLRLGTWRVRRSLDRPRRRRTRRMAAVPFQSPNLDMAAALDFGMGPDEELDLVGMEGV